MSIHRIVIEPDSKNANYWKDIWAYRGLFYFLAWRDVLVRYKQTVLGITWSVLKPLITIVVFTFVFHKLGHFPPDGSVPYAILVCAAALPWNFFSNAFSESANSLIGNSNLLTKVYFPRLIIPASSVMVSLIDFFISICILIGLFVFYHYLPDWRILLLPVFLLLATVTAFGSGLLIAALNVKYRDFRYIIPFIVQFGFFICPVGYSSSAVYGNATLPIVFKYLYSLNPMVAVIDGFRWSILGAASPLFIPGFVLSVLVSLCLLFYGLYYFRKTERSYADII